MSPGVARCGAVSRPVTERTEPESDAGTLGVWAGARYGCPPGPRNRPKVTAKARPAAASDPRTDTYAPAGPLSWTLVTCRPAPVSQDLTPAISWLLTPNRARAWAGVRK